MNPSYRLRKLFLDMVPCSSADVTRALSGCFRERFNLVLFRFVSFESEGNTPTLWGCLI